MVSSADDGLDIGLDSGAPVSPGYGPLGNAVQLAISDAAVEADHRVDPKDAIRLAMAGRRNRGTGPPRRAAGPDASTQRES